MAVNIHFTNLDVMAAVHHPVLPQKEDSYYSRELRVEGLEAEEDLLGLLVHILVRYGILPPNLFGSSCWKMLSNLLSPAIRAKALAEADFLHWQHRLLASSPYFVLPQLGQEWEQDRYPLDQIGIQTPEDFCRNVSSACMLH